MKSKPISEEGGSHFRTELRLMVALLQHWSWWYNI